MSSAPRTPVEDPDEGAPRNGAERGITIITPADRISGECSLASGLQREVCVEDERAWLGVLTAEPGTVSPWHREPARTSYLLPLQGHGIVELRQGARAALHADGTVYVIPPGLEHRVVNTGATASQLFLMRVGESE